MPTIWTSRLHEPSPIEARRVYQFFLSLGPARGVRSNPVWLSVRYNEIELPALASDRLNSKRSEHSTSLRAIERTEKPEQVSRVEVRRFDGGEMSAAVVFIPMDDVEVLVGAVAQNGIGWEYSNPRRNFGPWQRSHRLFFRANLIVEICGGCCRIGQPVQGDG